MVLLTGCAATLPSRQVTGELGVKQVAPKNSYEPYEYIFCDLEGGAWGCEPVSVKTLAGANSNVTKGVKVTNEEETPIASIIFDFDSSDLKPVSKVSLLDILPLMKGNKVAIHGYTDDVGTVPYNESLALDRAISVKNFFEKTGFSSDDMFTEGHGLCCYLVPNGTEIQRSKNRRVEVFLVK